MQTASSLPKSTSSQASELDVIAYAYMSDPAFTTCREDEMLWDTTIADDLDKS